MKQHTFKWVASNAYSDVITKATSFAVAQDILPISNQPYQPNVQVNDSGEFVNTPGYRTIGFTLTNAGSLAAPVNCTITGTAITLNVSNYISSPEPTTEVVVISSANAYVESTKYFDTVTSLSFDGPIPLPTTIKVGLGKKGVIPNFFDTDSKSPMSYSLQFYPLNGAAGFTYQYFISLLKPYMIISQWYASNTPFPDPICGFAAMAEKDNVPYIMSTSANIDYDLDQSIFGLLSPVTMGWLVIDDGGNGNGELYFSILQQGLC